MLMFRDLAVTQEHSNQHIKSGVPKYRKMELQQGEAFARRVLADSSLRCGRGCTIGQGVGLDVRVISRVAAGGGVRRESLQVDMDTLGSGPVAGRGFKRVPRCEGRPPVDRARVDLRTSVRPGLRSIRRARKGSSCGLQVQLFKKYSVASRGKRWLSAKGVGGGAEMRRRRAEPPFRVVDMVGIGVEVGEDVNGRWESGIG